MAGIKGLCTICNKVATHSCKICGRPFCKEHIDEKSLMCDSCMKKRL
ncbi:MAG: hypothetical protein KGH66_00800 [Candidatus Micrarchaeota archaeon]|nr:hypothetical protein [Candidatus Micrarchaeota archaeon]